MESIPFDKRSGKIWFNGNQRGFPASLAMGENQIEDGLVIGQGGHIHLDLVCQKHLQCQPTACQSANAAESQAPVTRGRRPECLVEHV